MRFFSAGIITFSFLAFFFVVAEKANAATLVNASNTITTSRPSPSSPLNAALLTGSSQAIIFNNGSRFLASDSARVMRTSSAALIDAGTIVASQSAALTTVYFGETAGVAANASDDVLFVPITAMHTIRFTIITEIPDEGDLDIVFPTLEVGDADNDASPSATTFQFNNLVPGGTQSNPTNIRVFDDSSDISADVTVTETEPTSGAAGRLNIEFDSGPIAAGSVITIMLGCSAASDEDTCTTQVPRIINPTKSAIEGTADTWKIALNTRDAADNFLDTATVAIATIESVQILATVDPTLTFTIAGIDNGDPVNIGNTTGCTQTETTNAGIDSTSTVVNLGILANTPAIDTKISNISAQLLTVSTNAAGGYSLTATSSGALMNHSSGYEIASVTTPAAFVAANENFGFHACGLDVDASIWTESSSHACDTEPGGSTANECYYAWPTQTSAITLASDPAGPVDTTIFDGNGLTSVSYAAGVDASVPAGTYQTYVTYVATATF